jgi:N-acetylglucosamine-6-sulfatase
MANHNVPPNTGVTDGRRKLIYYNKTHEWEFFDLETDPQEMKSQYYNPEYGETIEGLKQELKRLRSKYKCTSTINFDYQIQWPYEK